MSDSIEHILSNIEAAKIPVAQISRDTGINQRWLYALIGGQIRNPGYNATRKLEIYLQRYAENLHKRTTENNPAL